MPILEDPRPRKESLLSAEASSSLELIQDMSFVDHSPIVLLFDLGATNSFVSVSCVRKLKLHVSSMIIDLVVFTLTETFVLTS